MKIKLSELVSSPFRNFKLSPLSEAKVEALIESINTTGFWGNIIVRRNDEDKFEIIAGHHRREALRRMKQDETDVIVVKLTDAEVIQRISRDHDDTYEHDLAGLIELIAATVRLHAEGKIPAELMPVAKDTNVQHIRIAPSFVGGSTRGVEGRTFTTISIAKFLGYTKAEGKKPKKSVEAAIKFLEMMERKLLTEKDIQTFTRPDGAIVAEQVLKVCATEEKKAEVKSDNSRRKALDDAKETERQVEAAQKNLIEQRQREQKAAERLKELQKKQREDLSPKQEEKVKEQVKEVKKDLKDAGRQLVRTKLAIAKRKLREAEQKEKDRAEENRRREQDRAHWINTVVSMVAKTYDSRSQVRFSVIPYAAKDAGITPEEKKRLVTELKALRDRVAEDIAKF